MQSFYDKLTSAMSEIQEQYTEEVVGLIDPLLTPLGYKRRLNEWDDSEDFLDCCLVLTYNHPAREKDPTNDVEIDEVQISVYAEGSLTFYHLVERNILDSPLPYYWEEENYDDPPLDSLVSWIEQSAQGELQCYQEEVERLAVGTN